MTQVIHYAGTWYLAALIFGVWFNAYVARHQEDADSIVSLWVMFGVGTLMIFSVPNIGFVIERFYLQLAGDLALGVPVIGWYILRELFVVFTFGGLPMVIGSLYRFAKSIGLLR